MKVTSEASTEAVELIVYDKRSLCAVCVMVMSLPAIRSSPALSCPVSVPLRKKLMASLVSAMVYCRAPAAFAEPAVTVMPLPATTVLRSMAVSSTAMA